MANSVYDDTMAGSTGLTEAGTFIPEIWSDEVIAAYEKHLVLANLVKKISMKGKKGDTINIPKPTRGVAQEKAQNTAVTIQGNTEEDVSVAITEHWEYSRLIEDIVDVQALASLRQFYTGDAGYALANKVDTDLFALAKTFGDSANDDWVHSNSYFVDSTGKADSVALSTPGTGVRQFTDAAFRTMVQLMDEADVPMDGRTLIVPPTARNAILGIDRYVSSDFTTSGAVQNGQIGNLYGIDVYVSNNCPDVVSTDETTPALGKGAVFFHKDTMVLAEQQGIRSQTQYKQEYLGNLYTADTLYGVKALRPESGFVLATTGTAVTE